MIFLIASILSSTGIFITFKFAGRISKQLIPIITINYMAASLLGWGGFHNFSTKLPTNFTSWIPAALVIGVLFIVMFFLIGTSTHKAGMGITTIASKISVVIPVLFSMLFFGETITMIKIAGLAGAMVAILLIIKKDNKTQINKFAILLPLIIFAGSGIVDSAVKYAQETLVPSDETAWFSTFVFLSALVSGVVFFLIKLKTNVFSISLKIIIAGIILGAFNFGSLYFFIMALNHSGLDSSVVFTIINLSIVALSALFGIFIFKEKFTLINLAGLILAMLSIWFLT